MKRNPRWIWLLVIGLNGLGITLMWVYQSLTELQSEFAMSLGQELWSLFRRASSFSEALENLEATICNSRLVIGTDLGLQWIFYLGASSAFAVVVGLSLYRLRPWRPRFNFRVATLMLAIAFLGIEFAMVNSAWTLKSKWNYCCERGRYWESGPRDDSTFDESEEFRREKEQLFKHYVRCPWNLLFLNWQEFQEANGGRKHVKSIGTPIIPTQEQTSLPENLEMIDLPVSPDQIVK